MPKTDKTDMVLMAMVMRPKLDAALEVFVETLLRDALQVPKGDAAEVAGLMLGHVLPTVVRQIVAGATGNMLSALATPDDWPEMQDEYRRVFMLMVEEGIRMAVEHAKEAEGVEG